MLLSVEGPRGQLVRQAYDIEVMSCKSRLLSRDASNVEVVPDPTTAAKWVFLSNHAHVLLAAARDPDVRARDIAAQVGITERAAQRILSDLLAASYITKTKNGRRNRYTVNRQGPLRHPVLRELEIGPLLDILDQDGPAPAESDPR